MMKHSKKTTVAALVALGAMAAGTAVGQAVTAGSGDRAAVNGSSVSVNGADVSLEEMMTRALRAGATPAAALAQAIENGFGQAEVLAAAGELGIGREAIDEFFASR